MAKGRALRRKEALMARFAEAGFHPHARRGQNFLLDRNQAGYIARQGVLRPEDVVLEVGCGTGFLTTELAASGCTLLAVEIDPRLLEVAREATADAPNVAYLEADILAGKQTIEPRVVETLGDLLRRRGPGGALKTVANLPYSAGTPFVANLFSSPLPWARGVFLLQYEVARRLAAPPGDAEYGNLSVIAALAGTVTLARKVPPAVFWPRPRVESAVVVVDYAPVEQRLALPWTDLRAVSRALFCSRRKRLRNSLKGLFPRDRGGKLDALLARLGHDPDLRGERLSPAQILELARAWRAVADETAPAPE